MMFVWILLVLQLVVRCAGGQGCPPGPGNSILSRPVNFCNETCNTCATQPDDCFLFTQCLDDDKDCVCGEGLFVEDYEAQSAEQKLNHVWDLIRSTKDPTREWQSVTGFVAYSVLRIFQYPGDYYPEGNKKPLHGAFGSHAMIELDTSDADAHEYTGIFETGCEHAIMRASVGSEFPGKNNLMNAGFAIKCFIDGSPSANVGLMNDVVPSPDFDLWNRNYSNHYEPLTGVPSPTLCPLIEKFSQASSCPAKLGLAEWALPRIPGKSDICTTGVPVDIKVTAPYRLIFVPASGLRFASTAYCPQDYLDLMHLIPERTKIFDVYAQSDPFDVPNKKVFSVWTKSKFWPSSFGDDRLAFRHVPFETDARIAAVFDYEDWRNSVDAPSECQSPTVLPEPYHLWLPFPLENITCPLPDRTNCPAAGPGPPPQDDEDELQCPLGVGKKRLISANIFGKKKKGSW